MIDSIDLWCVVLKVIIIALQRLVLLNKQLKNQNQDKLHIPQNRYQSYADGGQQPLNLEKEDYIFWSDSF